MIRLIQREQRRTEGRRARIFSIVLFALPIVMSVFDRGQPFPVRWVVLLAPWMAAGSLVGQRRLATLDLLLSTPTPRWQIVTAAFLARFQQALFAVLCGFLLCGVDGSILAVVCVLALTMAVGVLLSAVCPGSVSTAIATTLATALLLQFLAAFSPTHYAVWEALVKVVRFPREKPDIPPVADTLVFVLVNVAVTIGCLALAARAIRFNGRSPSLDAPEVHVRTSVFRPAVTDEPFTWREWYARRPRPLIDGVLGLIGIQVVGAAIAAQMLWLLPADYRQASWWTSPVSVSVVLAACVLWAGVRSAVSVTREHERGTWPLLMLVPDGERRLLAAKRRAGILAPWPMWVVLLGMLVDQPWVGVSWLRVSVTVFASTSFIVASALIGVWVSTRCRRSLVAVAFWGIVMGFVAIPFALAWIALLQRGS